MRKLRIALALGSALAVQPVLAGPAEEAQRVYAEFVAAQNAHDLDRVRGLFLPGERFLWVTNGLSVWGPEAAVARLARFHANEVWRIEPDTARSRAVEVGAEAAFIHVPLVLVVGPAGAPQRYHILVSALCTATPDGWRIAALFTTDENREEAAR
jgi:ketosteroid isomerase-like protein